MITGAQEIVDLMAELVSNGEAALERRDGPEAVAVAQEIEGVLMSAMEGTLANVVLWEQFLSTPQDVGQALTGVVQALMKTDPVLAEWLGAAMVRYKEAAAD